MTLSEYARWYETLLAQAASRQSSTVQGYLTARQHGVPTMFVKYDETKPNARPNLDVDGVHKQQKIGFAFLDEEGNPMYPEQRIVHAAQKPDRMVFTVELLEIPDTAVYMQISIQQPDGATFTNMKEHRP